MRHDSAAEARHLLRGEGLAIQLLIQMERAEQVHDVVHPLGRSTSRPRRIRRARVGLAEPCHQFGQLHIRGAKHVWVLIGEVRSESQHPPRERQDQERLG